MKTMRMAFAAAVVAGTWMATTASEAAGQLTIGARLGWNLSTLSGLEDLEVSRETAAVGGLYVNLGGTVSVQPELLFSKRSAALRSDRLVGSFEQNFIEVPLLAVWRGSSGLVQPAIYGGASASFETDCDTDFTRLPDGPQGCDGLFGADTDSPQYAGILGGSVHLWLGPVSLGVDARYNHGVTDLTGNSDASWRYWSVAFEGSVGLGR